ncbi:hypothetical protein ACF0H5_024585 [Mactra antiquata]
MKSIAAVCFEPEIPLAVEFVDLDGPKEGEVMVRLRASGVCHTDAYTWSGADREGRFPVILGHEGAGEVVEIGTGVRSVAVGDHVIPLYTPECGQCKFCLSGKTNLCQAIRSTQGQGLMPDGTSRFSLHGKMLHHYMGTSTFSEYTVLPEIALAKINRAAPLEKVCLLGCGITTGIGAVRNTAKVEPGASVAVFGLGGIGLSVIVGAQLAQAGRIIAVDLNSDKFDIARQLGATDCLNPKDYHNSISDVIIDLTDGGVDYSFECIGNVKAYLGADEERWQQHDATCLIRQRPPRGTTIRVDVGMNDEFWDDLQRGLVRLFSPWFCVTPKDGLGGRSSLAKPGTGCVAYASAAALVGETFLGYSRGLRRNCGVAHGIPCASTKKK